MKKFKKAIIALSVCALAALGTAGLAACGDDPVSGTAEGDYHYSVNYGTEVTYGVKVSVTVEDGVITNVEIVDHSYIEATETVMEGQWDGGVDYKAKRDSLLQAYVGKTVDEVLSLTVATNDTGEPYAETASEFSDFGDDLIIAGSTQSSGRLLLAVQDALKNL